ncbi:MAG: hypothetical protein MHM6MM_001132 [Cercozoa sp. M6MM]
MQSPFVTAEQREKLVSPQVSVLPNAMPELGGTSPLEVVGPLVHEQLLPSLLHALNLLRGHSELDPSLRKTAKKTFAEGASDMGARLKQTSSRCMRTMMQFLSDQIQESRRQSPDMGGSSACAAVWALRSINDVAQMFGVDDTRDEALTALVASFVWTVRTYGMVTKDFASGTMLSTLLQRLYRYTQGDTCDDNNNNNNNNNNNSNNNDDNNNNNDNNETDRLRRLVVSAIVVVLLGWHTLLRACRGCAAASVFASDPGVAGMHHTSDDDQDEDPDLDPDHDHDHDHDQDLDHDHDHGQDSMPRLSFLGEVVLFRGNCGLAEAWTKRLMPVTVSDHADHSLTVPMSTLHDVDGTVIDDTRVTSLLRFLLKYIPSSERSLLTLTALDDRQLEDLLQTRRSQRAQLRLKALELRKLRRKRRVASALKDQDSESTRVSDQHASTSSSDSSDDDTTLIRRKRAGYPTKHQLRTADWKREHEVKVLHFRTLCFMLFDEIAFSSARLLQSLGYFSGKAR